MKPCGLGGWLGVRLWRWEAERRFPLKAKASGCTRRSFLRLGLGIAA